MTLQNRDILRELEVIADQDEHVRVILDRKNKVDQIKQSTEDRLRKWGNINNKTFSTALTPEYSPYKNSVTPFTNFFNMIRDIKTKLYYSSSYRIFKKYNDLVVRNTSKKVEVISKRFFNAF